MFNVFAFLLRPPTWLYVLLTKLLFFFFPSPLFSPLSLSISSSPNRTCKYVCPIDSSLARFSSSLDNPSSSSSPVDSFFAACARDTSSANSFLPPSPSNILFTIAKKQANSSKRQNREIGRGKFFFENSSFSKRNMLVYGINILLEPRRRREVVKTASAKTRSTPKTRDRLESLEFTARHIGCESARN